MFAVIQISPNQGDSLWPIEQSEAADAPHQNGRRQHAQRGEDLIAAASPALRARLPIVTRRFLSDGRPSGTNTGTTRYTQFRARHKFSKELTEPRKSRGNHRLRCTGPT